MDKGSTYGTEPQSQTFPQIGQSVQHTAEQLSTL